MACEQGGALLLRLCGVVVLLSLLAGAPPGLPASPTEQFTGTVVGLRGGDTLSVLRDGSPIIVRLYGIDTPGYTQPFSTTARQFTEALVLQQAITVVMRGTDQYRRLVGEVLLSDGRNLGHELLRAGLAWWAQRYTPRDTVLQQLESEARTAQRGLWGEAHPVPPWQWRKPSRSSPSPAHVH